MQLDTSGTEPPDRPKKMNSKKLLDKVNSYLKLMKCRDRLKELIEIKKMQVNDNKERKIEKRKRARRSNQKGIELNNVL